MVGRVGLLWRFGAGACPNLPQRRPAAGLAANRSAEYQRFFSCAPARSGPLWQILTVGALGPAGGVSAGRAAGPAPDRTTPPGPALAPMTPPGARERSLRRISAPGPVPGGLTHLRVPPGRPRSPRTRRFPVERVPPICAFDWKPTRSRRTTGRRLANRPQNAPFSSGCGSGAGDRRKGDGAA